MFSHGVMGFSLRGEALGRTKRKISVINTFKN
jgi:hypothetical protein